MTKPSAIPLAISVFLSMVCLIAASASPDHPRLLFPTSEEAAIKKRIQDDPLAGDLYDVLIQRADHALTQRTCRYEIPDGRRLLGESRYALDIILHTAMAWRLSGEKKYFDRTVRELDAACSLENWNTSHFLDTAEMSTAVAIGYDWLYPELTTDQRRHYANTLRSHGLEPARKGFTGNDKAWWTDGRNNWTQVCATGLLFAERALEKPGDPIHPARLAAAEALENCSRFYLPSGAYPEGPGYWHYGSNYHVLGLAALRGDHSELHIPTPREFKTSPLFTEHLTGPSGKVFNFADASLSTTRITPAQSWMAGEFNNPNTCMLIRTRLAEDLARLPDDYRSGSDRLFPLHLLWLPAEPSQKLTPQLELDSAWQGTQPLATFRTSWEDPDALFVAIKGGYPGVSHGQMDIGSFVLESDGVRWVEDLGRDNYNMPGYFGDERWTYFRMTNLSHNTLVIGNQLQHEESAPCPMTQFKSTEDKGSVTFDLSSAYGNQADKVIRHCLFDRENRKVTITDNIAAAKDNVRWAIMTSADIEISGKVATLVKSGQQLKVTRRDSHGGEWKVLEAKPPKKIENQNHGLRILAFTAPKEKQLELKVTFSR